MKKQELLEQELIERIDSRSKQLQEQIDTLQTVTTELATAAANANIVNLVDNTDWNWSTLAYTTPGTTPATAGDANNRAFNFYRIQRATALLVEDDAHSLKSSGHSLFAGETADTPIWDKTNGWAALGETGATPWDICCPLPNNFVTPGMRFRIQMLVRLGTPDAIPGLLRFFWLFHDNTNSAPAPQTIKGSAFTLDGATFGPLGATTRSYKLIVDVDSGNQVESTVKTITDTPTTLTAENGVALAWPQYPGFTRVSIYVTEGGASFLVTIIGNGANAFNDTGQRLGPVDAVPTVTGTQAQAYAEAVDFRPTTAWELWRFNIVIPQTYNFGLTTGKQWLRGGVIGLMGAARQLQIDRLGVSTGDGLWSPSIRDLAAASPPSTTQTSSQQGPPTGGGGDPGGDPGDGEGRCSTLDTPVDVCDEDGRNERKIQLGEVDQRAVERGLWLVSKTTKPNRVKNVKIGWSELILTIRTENGAGRRCSPSDLWLEASGPTRGTAARRLSEGTEVLTRKDGQIVPSMITTYDVSTSGEEVRLLELEDNGHGDDDHIYVAGDALCHNVKPLEFF